MQTKAVYFFTRNSCLLYFELFNRNLLLKGLLESVYIYEKVQTLTTHLKAVMASNARTVFSQQIDDDGETPMFVIEKNDSLRIRKGQYSIKMSYYNRKVYFHIQSKL